MKYRFGILVLIAAVFTFTSVAPADSWAATQKQSIAHPSKAYRKATGHRHKVSARRYRSSSSQESHYSALVVDADTGKILYERNAGAIRYPASLTKMMTLYLTFEALKSGKISMDDTLPVSVKAAAQPQTNISLERGERLPVKIAIESVVVRSANDSAMVLAENLGGTQWNFALMMTKKAHELGMKDTIFDNPNGLPDNKQHTTAYDMAKLAIALKRDFPEYYHFFSLLSFDYNGITYPGHNHVMERYAGVDGVKTGYIRASGFNLVTSAHRDDFNVVAVIMGGATARARDNQMIALLDTTFNQMAALKKDGSAMADEDAKKNSLEASNVWPDKISN